MKANQASRTAENNAFVRAVEALKPENERLCNDPLAVHFLGPALRNTYDNVILRNLLLKTWEFVAPGVCGAVLARTRFFDDCLENCIEQGLRQLVILGAGYDTRALRFPKLKKNITVFELDHPATQAQKSQKLQRMLGSLPDHVIYIPIRFDTQNLGQELTRHGCRHDLQTLFIWEGVTYYLSPQAVDQTLHFIARNSGQGSSVIFDYFPPSVADGTCSLKEAQSLRRGLKNFGEEIVFGIDPERIDAFLAEHGFNPIQNMTSAICKQTYFKGTNRHRNVSEIFAFVHAAVNAPHTF